MGDKASRGGIVLGEYTLADNDDALALERSSPQGGAFRLTFRRPTFHRRAELFPVWRLVTARSEGRLVGTVGMAIKDVVLHGSPTQAAFAFDLRVHPDFRRRGIARRLTAEALSWGFARAELGYLYAVRENRALRRIGELFGAEESAGYDYLVCPARSPRNPRHPATRANLEAVDAGVREFGGPFDFYANPRPALEREAGCRGSWIAESGADRAGCSAFTFQQILAEVVVSLPLPLRAATALEAVVPRRLRRWPHIPRPGEEVRSWYLFDFYATGLEVMNQLLGTVAAEARAAGVDYLYLIHPPGHAVVREFRASLPRLFSPSLSYRVLAKRADGAAPGIGRLHVDVRDV